MAKNKSDESFGLDPSIVSKIDWDLALSRVLHDLRSDFIWAPHIRFLYNFAGKQLISQLKSALEAGTFHPGVPLTIEVPKSFRIQIGGSSKRLGPNFSRPGSVLPPRDRIFYQALADQAAPLVDKLTNKSRSFSHWISGENNPSMFISTRKSWGNLQKSLRENSKIDSYKYILRLDIANYFGSINQHTLINTLNDGGYDHRLSDKLEKLLTSYTGQKSSRGILQGIYASDLFGAFYMNPIDRFFDDNAIVSARYVDDIYLFAENVDKADHALRALIVKLRSYDLSLNEVKSTIIPKNSLFTEEPDLELLFANAVEEITDQIEDADVDVDYGFQKEWDEGDEEATDDNDGNDDLELKATKKLFDSIDNFPGHEESIERFCLPLFTQSESDHAINHVIESLKKRPSMTQIYAAYLGKFINSDKTLSDYLHELLLEKSLFDWQKMWIIAALSQVTNADDKSVKTMMAILSDGTRHDALRAVAAIYVGRLGDHARRKNLFSVYSNVSEYIQLAIYFSSRNWPKVERGNARSAWGGHTSLNKLMSECIKA